MSPAATPSGWGLGVSDTSTNRMCIAGFSVSPTTVYGFCNGNTTTRSNPGTYAGSTSQGWISFTGAGAVALNTTIATDAVDSNNILALSISTGKLRDDAVTSAKLGPEAVDSASLKSAVITSAKLASAVTLIIYNSAGSALKTLYGAGS